MRVDALLHLLLPLSLVLLWPARARGRQQFNSYAGPYDVRFKEHMPCPEVAVAPGRLAFNLSGLWRHTRQPNDMVFDGAFRLWRDVHPGFAGVKVDIAKWDSVAGWRTHFYRMDAGEFCLATAAIGSSFLAELNKINPDIPKGCPFKEGTYAVPNVSTSKFSEWGHFPALIYGRYRGDLLFYDLKTRESVACVRGVAEVVPKANG